MVIINFFIILLIFIINSITKYNSFIEIVFSFFIAIIPFIIISRKSSIKLEKKKIYIISFTTIILLIICLPSLLVNYKKSEITIKNTSKKVVLVDSIYLDDNKIELNKKYDKKYDLVNKASFKTEYKIQNKETSDYKMILYPNESYKIKLKKVRKVQIEIQRQKKDLDIKIDNKKINIKKQDYKNKQLKIYIINNYNYKYKYDNHFMNLLNIKSIFIIILTGYLFFTLIQKCITNKDKIIMLLPIIVEFNPIGKINLITKLFLILLLIFLLNKEEKNISNREKIILIPISFIISFTFLGQYLIDEFSIFILLFYIIVSIFIYLLIPFIIGMLDNINFNKVDNNKKIIWHKIFILIICMACLIGYRLLFSPYILLTDGGMELDNILNNTISNWHPYFHTIFIKIFYVIFHNFTSFIYFRIFIYSLLMMEILFYFYSKGLKLLYVYIIAILFTANPVTGTIMVTMVKDVDFSIVILILMYSMYLILNDFKYFNKNLYNYIIFLFSLIGVAFFRHNGIYVAIIIALIILVYGIKNKRRFLIFILILFSLCSFYIKKPLYNKLKIEAAPRNFDIATMIHGFGYLIKYDKDELSNETYEYLIKNVMSEENFKIYYDKYNIDAILHYNSVDEKLKIRDKKIDKSKIINLYIKQIFKSPISLLKDRIYGTNILWNVIEKDEVKNMKYQVNYDEFDIHYNKIKKSNIVNKIVEFIYKNDLLNILFFRVGIYIDIMMILLFHNYINKKKGINIISAPLFIYLFTLFVAMHYQGCRYGWMIPGCTLLFSLITFCNKKIDNKN